MTTFIEQAEKALEDCLESGEVGDMPHLLRQSITEVRARDKAVELSNGLIADLKAENAKLRQELDGVIKSIGSDPTPSPWRDIESAPKHTPVDLLGHYPGKNPKPRRIPDCKLNSQGRWTTKHRDNSGHSLLRSNFIPTHWMPLPDGPGDAS